MAAITTCRHRPQHHEQLMLVPQVVFRLGCPEPCHSNRDSSRVTTYSRFLLRRHAVPAVWSSLDTGSQNPTRNRSLVALLTVLSTLSLS